MEKELSREDVLKIASLARLELSETEVADYQKKLGRVVGHVTELNAFQLDTKGFPQHVPLDSVSLREDVAGEYVGREDLLRNAPLLKDNCFALPALMEET